MENWAQKAEITGTWFLAAILLYLFVDVSSACESVDRLALSLVDPLDCLVDVFDHSLSSDDASELDRIAYICDLVCWLLYQEGSAFTVAHCKEGEEEYLHCVLWFRFRWRFSVLHK